MAANKSAKCPGTLLLGKASFQSTLTKITAAKRIRKNPFFCIDNVHIDCTVDDMKAFVSSLPVEVVSCHEVRSRRLRNESVDTPVNRKAFRLCIYDEDWHCLLNPSLWPDSVTISVWYFKPRAEGDSKRRRLSVTDQAEDQAAMITEDVVNSDDNDDTILEDNYTHTYDGEQN